jgi:hypothetical protein
MYDTIILLTCHESKECVIDCVENIFKFNKNICIVINSALSEGELDDIKTEHVHVVDRPFESRRMVSLIRSHIELWDYIKKNNIQSQYLITLASNQLFIKHEIYDFMKIYKAGYYARGLDASTVESIQCNCKDKSFCQRYLDDLGLENFVHQSNHDGMFYRWDVFSNMMQYFDSFRDRFINHWIEEFFYPAYLFKHIPKEEMTDFSKYNCWPPEGGRFTLEQIQNVDREIFYIVKRIPREYDEPVREYIRSLT